jgi:hypothetical protein
MRGAKLKGDDSVDEIVQCLDHDSVLFFTSDGVVRSLKAHQIPQASRTAIGSAITQVPFCLLSFTVSEHKLLTWSARMLNTCAYSWSARTLNTCAYSWLARILNTCA